MTQSISQYFKLFTLYYMYLWIDLIEGSKREPKEMYSRCALVVTVTNDLNFHYEEREIDAQEHTRCSINAKIIPSSTVISTSTILN